MDATIAVTYKCNARCKFCGIWQLKPEKEIGIEVFKKLPRLNTINITGGEPFLREDLPEIIEVLTEKSKPRIVISSNGLSPSIIEKKMKEIIRINPEVGVGISLDGIGEKHNMLRGVPNAFNLVLNTIKILKKYTNDIRIDFTTSNENFKELLKVYDLSKKLNVQFTSTVVHSSENYFHKNNPKPSQQICIEYKKLLEKELKRFHPKCWFRAYFYHNLINFIEGKKFRKDCSAAKDFFFLDPYGNIFPCVVMNIKLGNLVAKSWDEIWNSKFRENVQKKLEKCDRCWMMCSAAPYIKKHMFDAFKWIIPNKLKHFI